MSRIVLPVLLQTVFILNCGLKIWKALQELLVIRYLYRVIEEPDFWKMSHN